MRLSRHTKSRIATFNRRKYNGAKAVYSTKRIISQLDIYLNAYNGVKNVSETRPLATDKIS